MGAYALSQTAFAGVDSPLPSGSVEYAELSTRLEMRAATKQAHEDADAKKGPTPEHLTVGPLADKQELWHG